MVRHGPARSRDLRLHHCDRVEPEILNAYFNRALAWQAKSDLDAAIADFSDVIRLDPEFTNAYYGRGQVYMAKGDPDDAIADLSDAIRLDPNRPYVYYLRGAAWYDRYMRASASINPKDLERAIANFTKAIHFGPHFAGAYYARGLVRSTNGQHDRAVADLTEAVRLDPTNPEMAAALKAAQAPVP
jgi:tetratricopeptide (TPR) repeat protein